MNNRKSKMLIYWVIVLMLLSVEFLDAQQPIQTLKLDQPIERAIKGGETQVFQFEVKAGHYARAEVEQKNIDVIVSLFAPDGKLVVEMDGKDGRLWREAVSCIAVNDGEFRVEIKAYGATDQSGSYVIKLAELRESVPNDRKRLEAEAHLSAGIKFYLQSKNQEAVKEFEVAVGFWRELRDAEWEAVTLINLGWANSGLSKEEQAIDAFTQATKLFQQTGDQFGESRAVTWLGNSYRALSQYDKAREFYEKALIIRRKIGDKRGEGWTLRNLGNAYNSLGQYEKAIDFFEESLVISREIKDGDEGFILIELGNIYEVLDEFEKSVNYYKRAVEIIPPENFDKRYLSYLAGKFSDYGRQLNKENDMELSLSFLNLSLYIYKLSKSESGQAIVNAEIGLVYSNYGEMQKAIESYKKALLQMRDSSSRRQRAATLSDLGTAYAILRNNKTALKYYAQALAIQRIEDRLGAAITLNSIGQLYLVLDYKSKSLIILNEALKMFNLIEKNNFIDKERGAYGGTGQGEFGRPPIRVVVEVDKMKFFIAKTKTLNGIALVYLKKREKSKSLEHLNQALILSMETDDKNVQALTLNNLGKAFFLFGESQKAVEFYAQALPLLISVGDIIGEARTLHNLMLAYNSLNQTKLAIIYGKKSVNGYQQIRSKIKGLDKNTQRIYEKSIVETYRYLADILIKNDRLPEAQAVLDLLKEEEFSGLVRRGGEVSENIPYNKAEDVALKVLDQLAVLGREKGELDDKNENEALTESERQRFKDLQIQIEITEAEFNKTIAALSAESNKTDNFGVVEKDAQAFMSTLRELGRGTLALYTVIVNDSKPTDNANEQKKEPIKTGWIILVTPEFRKAYPVDVKDLEQTIFNFRTTLTSPVYDPLPFARELYKKMFLQAGKDGKTLAADLDEYFKDKPNKTLMWSLDGIFRYVPIAALHDGNTYLVEKYRNTIFNTASKDRLKDAVKPTWTALGLGVSLGRTESGKTFSALDGAKKELLKIVKQDTGSGIMKGTIKLDDQFTGEAMFDALSFDKNPLVHIASHFSYQIADFDSSFLLLGKGTLTVKDLRVKSTLFNGVDLLTLSACETAVPDANGKDVEGFAYLAQSLGAKAVMATLWQVDDIGTQVLMPEFYRLHETGLDKAESLREAQLALLQGKIKDLPADVKRSGVFNLDPKQTKLEKYNAEGKPPFAHPFYWSPFVLIGNWR